MKISRFEKIHRCSKCRINKEFCFCDLLKTVDIKSKVSIVMHANEITLISNTAYLAELTINKSSIFIRGLKDHEFDAEELVEEGYENLYLYPSDDSQVLNSEYLGKIDKPINLIVPDGSWRQARKYVNREETFKNLKKVRVENIGESIYQLRKSPGRDSLCTFEAIAYALKEIEGEEVFHTLIDNLRYMVRAHLTTKISDKKELRKMLLKVGINEI